MKKDFLVTVHPRKWYMHAFGMFLSLLFVSVCDIHAQMPTTVAGLYSRTFTNGNLGVDKDGNPLDMTTGATGHLAPGSPASGIGSNAINIPWPSGFSFQFPTGTTSEQVVSWSVASNGIISLSSTASSSITTANNISGGTGFRMGSFVTGTTNGGVANDGIVQSKVFGSSPNQVFVVEFKGMRFTNSSQNPAGDVNHQVRFYENGNFFEFVYGDMSLGAGSSSAVRAGFSTGSTSSTSLSVNFSSHSVTASTAANNFSTVGPLPAFTSTPSTRRVYLFSPTPFPQNYIGATFTRNFNDLVAVGSKNNEMGRFQVVAAGSGNPLQLEKIKVDLERSIVSNISSIKLYATSNSSLFIDTLLIDSVIPNGPSVTLNINRPLLDGSTYFHITCDVSSSANVGDTLFVNVDSLTLSGVTYVAGTYQSTIRVVQMPLSGTYTVGAGGSFPNLRDAFSTINQLALAGNTTFEIVSDINEPSQAVLGKWQEIGLGGYYLTIKPSGAPRTITGPVGNPTSVLGIQGASRVVIDGRLSNLPGSTNALTIRGGSPGSSSSAVIVFINTKLNGVNDPAHWSNDITIRNCNIIGDELVTPTYANNGISFLPTGTYNKHIHITENSINGVFRGIFVSTNTENLEITKNQIGSNLPVEYVRGRGIVVNNAKKAKISHNVVYNMMVDMTTTIAGIEITGAASDSITIESNLLTNIKNAHPSGWGAYGINLSGGSNHLLVNNSIAGVSTDNYSATSNAFNAFGIRIVLGTNHRIYHNTVHLSGEYNGTNTTAGAAAMCITSTAVSAQLKNNIFSNTITSTASGNKNFFAIWLPSSFNFANLSGSDYNNYFVGNQPYHFFGQRGTTVGTNIIADLSSWQGASALDSNSSAVFPAFLSSSNGKPNAFLLNNTAIPLPEVSLDIEGNVRSSTTPDMGAYEFSPITKDLVAGSLQRLSVGCLGSSEMIQAKIINVGQDPFDLSVDSVVLMAQLLGTSHSVTVVANTGVLMAGDTLVMLAGPFDLSSYGSYSISASFTNASDILTSNNQFANVNFTNTQPDSLPYQTDFSESTVLSSYIASDWSFSGFWAVNSTHGRSNNGMYSNIWSSNPRVSASLPLLGPVTSTSFLSLDYRLVNFSGYPNTPYQPGGRDSILLEVSGDCESTFQTLYLIDSNSHSPDTSWRSVSLPLGQYAGSNIRVRIRGIWYSGDYYLDIDNVSIVTALPEVKAEVRSRSTSSVVIAAAHNQATFSGSMGVVYSTTPNPTLASNNYWDAGANNNLVARLEGLLQPGTTYYIRAYMQSQNGQQVFYSDEMVVNTFNGPQPQPIVPIFSVRKPASQAGTRQAGFAVANSGWGFTFDTLAVEAPLVVARSGISDSLACDSLINAFELNGKIAVIYRGSCAFSLKALAAVRAGAVGVLIINNAPGTINMTAGVEGVEIDVPVMMISNADGAQLRPFIDNGEAVALMGNKNGQFAFDLALLQGETVGPDASTIFADMVAQPGQYVTPMGAYVLNAGVQSTSQYYLEVSVHKEVAGQSPQQVYNAFQQLAPNTAPGQLGYLSVPAIDWGASNFGPGNYIIRYTAMPWSGINDGFMDDNTFERRFSITDSLYAKTRLDSNGNLLLDGSGTRFGGVGSWAGGNWFEFQGSNNKKVSALRFAFVANPGQSLTGEVVVAQVLEWTDANNDSLINPGELIELAEGFYTYPSNLSNEQVEVPVYNLSTNQPGIDVQPGGKYIFSALYTGTNMNVFLATDPGTNYSGTSRQTGKLISAVSNGVDWFLNGFGPQTVFAIAAVIGDAAPPALPIMGMVQYDNSANTPMSNTMVMLYEQQNVVAQTTTDGGGIFDFGAIAPGSYTIRAMTNKMWGGVNATDALAIARSFTGAAPLAGIRFDAADVNASETVNATDALQVARRFTNQINSFALGDWVFKADGFSHTSTQPSMVNVKALAVGDVNGSYVPGNFRRLPLVSVQEEETVQVSDAGIWITAQVMQAIELGAVSLDLRLPEGIEVLQVKSRLAGGEFNWNVKEGVLYLSWYSLMPVALQANAVVVDLLVRQTAAVGGSWYAGAESELANGLAEVHGPAQLRLPRLVDGSIGLFAATAYPNPTRDASTLSLNLPTTGKVSIRITDALGRVVFENAQEQSVGSHQLKLPTERWAAGTYHISVLFEGDITEVQQLRLQVVR